jgi:uncharacterized Zn-finger protein
MSKSESLCRICVKEKAPLVSILEDNPLNLQEKLLKLLKIKVTNEYLKFKLSRVCWLIDGAVDSENNKRNMKINDKIHLQVSEESLLPKQLCLDCLTKLNQFNEFYVQTHENQVILQVLFGEKCETLNESTQNKSPAKCIQRSTQTDAPVKTQSSSETYILIENFQTDNNQNSNYVGDETILEEDETSQDTSKLEIEEQLEIMEEDDDITSLNSPLNETKNRKKFDRFDCYLCKKQLTGNFQFLKHFSTAHPKDEIRYQCFICQGFVKKYRSYTRHIESHTGRRFECDVCNQKFSQKITLVTHLSSHSSLKKFECKDCKLSFKQNSSLFKHRKQKHSSEVPTCHECNRTFVNKDTFQQHLKSKHNQQLKDVNCTECEKKFASKSALAYHRLSNHSKNSGEQLKCENCSDEFKNRIILARHRKKCTKST